MERCSSLPPNPPLTTSPPQTTPHPTHQEPVAESNQPGTRRLVRSGALAGAIAAVCTTVVAAIASAADVSLEIDAKAIPIPGSVVDPRRCRPGRRAGPTPLPAPTVRRRHHSRRRPVAHPSDRSSRRHRHQSRSRGDPPPRRGHHHPDSRPAAPPSATTANGEATLPRLWPKLQHLGIDLSVGGGRDPGLCRSVRTGSIRSSRPWPIRPVVR